MSNQETVDRLREQASILKEAADYIAEHCDEGDEIDVDELCRDIAQHREERLEELEERQHQSGFYAFQDLMDMYRFER